MSARHCEERSDEAIQSSFAALDCFASLAMTELHGRHYRPLNLAKADTVAIALAPAAHDQRIAVFEKCPDDAARQLNRLGAVPADFKQAAALGLVRAADGATPKEIADIHGAAG